MSEGYRAFCTSEINLESYLQGQVKLHAKRWLPNVGVQVQQHPITPREECLLAEVPMSKNLQCLSVCLWNQCLSQELCLAGRYSTLNEEPL